MDRTRVGAPTAHHKGGQAGRWQIKYYHAAEETGGQTIVAQHEWTGGTQQDCTELSNVTSNQG